MDEKWLNATVTDISFAQIVPAGTGKVFHQNRFHHGFVLNDKNNSNIYTFSDGRTLRTESGCLFYLPKGSTYRVKKLSKGCCYAINFDLCEDFIDEPFSIKISSYDYALTLFKRADKEWRKHAATQYACAKSSVYSIIELAYSEVQKSYFSSTQEDKIAPALNYISSSFTEADISISQLAKLCSMSETYFRKLFAAKTGASPKAYITQKRIEHAKKLIKSGQYKISEIAVLCGYDEPCHFTREFKKRVGVSPKDFI